MPTLYVPRPTTDLIASKTSIGYLRDLLALSSFDYDNFGDKFWGDLILDEYPAAKTNGTSAAVTFTEHNENGYLELVTGTDNAGYAGQGMGMQFTGDRGVLAEFLVKTPAVITSFKMEVGLSDADDDAGAVNQKATTTTATATDFAVFVYDTSDDANLAFITAKGGVVVEAKQDIVALAASTFYRFGVRIDGDNVDAYINGNWVAGSGGGAGIEGGNKLTPWAFAQVRVGSASKTLQLHKWRAVQPAYS